MTWPPVPEPDAASEAFFAALDAGRLRLDQCTGCGTRHLAALVCDVCGITDFVSVAATGMGSVHSFTRMHMVHHPAFAEDVPFAAGVVELDEGPRLFARLVGANKWAIGDRVIAELRNCDGRGMVVFRRWSD